MSRTWKPAGTPALTPPVTARIERSDTVGGAGRTYPRLIALRVIRLAAIAAAACVPALVAWALGRDPLALAPACLAAAGILAAVLAVNATPLFYRPAVSWSEPEPGRIRWEDAAPTFHRGGNARLLFCVHGFPSTPSDYRALAGAAAARGWDLYAPLLPGCGTGPADLTGTNWYQWLAYLRGKWLELRPRYPEVCLVGTSMGGSLSLALAEEFSADPGLAPSALATLGSPIVLNAFLRHGMVKHPLIYVARMVGWVLPSIGAGLPPADRSGRDGDERYRGYLGMYPRQTYSMALGLRETERRLGLIRCPAFVCHSPGDRVVPFGNRDIIARGLASRRLRLVGVEYEGADHRMHNVLLYESSRGPVWSAVLDFFGETTGGGTDHDHQEA